MSQPNRLAADAAHRFGGIELDRGKPLRFRLNGRRIDGFAGDTVLSAVLAAGIDTYGLLGNVPLALGPHFAPLVAAKGTGPLPMERLLAADGLDLTTTGHRRAGLGRGTSLGQRIDGIADPPWLRHPPAEQLTVDLLVIGGGLAGLAAAEAAAKAGRSVIVAERRPWFGGDARFFGAVGDEESPEAAETRLLAALRDRANVTLMRNAEVFALNGSTALLHRIEDARGRVVSVAAARIVLATGSIERLPIFAGNRLPGVTPSLAAYHLAKRYGVAQARSAIVATQGNVGYRLALRLNDAGVAVSRVADIRLNPQSRFVDFAKAGGLTLAGGQSPIAVAIAPRRGLQISLATTGSTLTLEADQLIVNGPLQPDLALWMQAGGGTHWVAGKLEARGEVAHIALTGAAAGYRSMTACLASGRVAAARLFGGAASDIADPQIDAMFETPDAANLIAPVMADAPAFLDGGASLIIRPVPDQKPLLTSNAHAPSLGDVAASVELGLVSPADAGAVAEERGAPGGDLAASDWRPAPADVPETPSWLAARFADGVRRHLVVDGRRKFEPGALVYANTARRDPMEAIGVIVAAAPEGQPGGIALLSAAALASTDRFIVERLDGPSPARFARA